MIRWPHEMPFGAHVLSDGRVRFRLWAPEASKVQIRLRHEAAERCLDMEPVGAGWLERVTGDAAAGDRYRFRISRRGTGEVFEVPDPASRFQPQGVHGDSEIIDPAGFDWGESERRWAGRPWEEMVFYELHLGTFTPEGTSLAAIQRLDHLVALGVSAIELMPVAAFPGQRDWGYDGVLQFAPAAAYGRPDDLRSLVQAAHQRGLCVFLDVVYNHFGPEGNYLHLYAPQFFTERHQTPWGAGVNFDGDHSRQVRDFFIHNALHWLREYRFDGLRLDAVHMIVDDSRPHFLTELARAVQDGPGRERRVHLVLENDHNAASRLAGGGEQRLPCYHAQWNDDFHHALHVLITGERDGYYCDYAQHPARHLARCLAEGFAYQGEASAFRDGRPRGEPSTALPATAFVNLLQNHDQAGNRALGERIHHLAPQPAVAAALALLLLAPSPPLLFMGQELMCDSPFLFFCDFGPDFAESVSEGRRREFAAFPQFADPSGEVDIPDPNDPETFLRSKIDWGVLGDELHRRWLGLHRELLEIRRAKLVPLLKGIRAGDTRWEMIGSQGIWVQWLLGEGSILTLTANLGAQALRLPPGRPVAPVEVIFSQPDHAHGGLERGELPPWSVVWHLSQGAGVPV